MERWSRMVLRLYAPAAGALLLAVVAMVLLEVIRHSPTVAGMYGVMRWMPVLAVLAALVTGGAATLRLWHWKRSDAVPVCECGGMLGRVRGAPNARYRSCLACGARVDVAE